jgi:hypothetical protein
MALTTPICVEIKMANHDPITIARFWSKVDVKRSVSECWEWRASKRKSGYGRLRKSGYTYCASRLAFEIFYGEKLGSRFACHHCDNPSCCNPHHIYAGDVQQNVSDAMARGRLKGFSLPGDRNTRALISNADIPAIRQLIHDGKTNKEIAALYGVHHATISTIRTGKAWTSVEGGPETKACFKRPDHANRPSSERTD